MKSKKIVIALGGNALEKKGVEPTNENIEKTIKKAVKKIVEIVKLGHKVVLVHGNGPQVGRIVIQNELAKNKFPPSSFDVCDAMSQGMIGYYLSQKLIYELNKNKIEKQVTAIITQIIVDKKDSHFSNPTKPIGPFYNQSQVNKLKKTNPDYIIKKDSNRGFRRVVASPIPQKIVELNTIKTLIKSNEIVICAGGGGIPVIEKKNSELVGVSAVIDKDNAASLLAKELDFDILLILTAVDFAYTNFGTTKQKKLTQIKVNDLEKLITENHFASGSMLPKIQAGINFANFKKNKLSIIGSLDKALKCVELKSGTIISK